MRNPRAFGGGVRPLEGGDWIVGRDRWRQNPRHALAACWFHVVRLWLRCRGEGVGLVSLPEAGGVNDQPAWIMAAFDVLAAAEADARTTQGAA